MSSPCESRWRGTGKINQSIPSLRVDCGRNNTSVTRLLGHHLSPSCPLLILAFSASRRLPCSVSNYRSIFIMKRFALPSTNSLSLGRRGFLINFLAALLIYQVIVATQTPWASEAAQVHGTIAQIRERGQLFIELFPPLSYLAIHLTHHTHMVVRLVCPAVVAIVLPTTMGISGK